MCAKKRADMELRQDALLHFSTASMYGPRCYTATTCSVRKEPNCCTVTPMLYLTNVLLQNCSRADGAVITSDGILKIHVPAEFVDGASLYLQEDGSELQLIPLLRHPRKRAVLQLCGERVQPGAEERQQCLQKVAKNGAVFILRTEGEECAELNYARAEADYSGVSFTLDQESKTVSCTAVVENPVLSRKLAQVQSLDGAFFVSASCASASNSSIVALGLDEVSYDVNAKEIRAQFSCAAFTKRLSAFSGDSETKDPQQLKVLAMLGEKLAGFCSESLELGLKSCRLSLQEKGAEETSEEESVWSSAEQPIGTSATKHEL